MKILPLLIIHLYHAISFIVINEDTVLHVRYVVIGSAWLYSSVACCPPVSHKAHDVAVVGCDYLLFKIGRAHV